MLNKLFDENNAFFQSMTTVFDLFAVNCLWLLCCLPIVTIGPATTALFYALIQKARKEDGYISHDFFRSFKQNLKQGMILGIPLTLIGAFLAFDVRLCYISGKGIYTFFMVFFAIFFIIWAFTTLYAFPLLAKFERKNSEILIWAFTLSIKNISMTLTMFFVIVAGLWILHIVPGLIFIMVGIVAQFCTTIIASILKPYLPKPVWMDDYGFDDNTEYGSHSDNTYSDFDEAAFYGYDLSALDEYDEEK